MKNRILTIMVSLTSVLLVSCNDFLDTTPTDRVSDKMIWSNVNSATLYLNTFYAYLDRYGKFGADQFHGNMTEGLTETLKYGGTVAGSMAGEANIYVFNPASMTPESNLLNAWTSAYERIRRMNEYLVSQKKYSTLSNSTNAMLSAQVRFFRAFVYFQLARRYDGVILYTDMNLSKNKNRSTADATWDLIAEDLDYAASVLPPSWDAANAGRVTKGAAYALKARAMLYAGRWQAAKDAADEVFKLSYALTDSYEDAWKGGNSESILECNYLVTGPSHTFDQNYVPTGDGVTDGGGAAGPTQEMVESYEKKDGTKVDWTPWHTTTTTPPPYADLEPRFHATVLYNGAKWKGATMENSVGGSHGTYMDYGADTYAKGRTVTGYYMRKHLDEKHTDFTAVKASTQPWVEIRLAEVYLIRAEAFYRLNEPSKALADMNEVRTRKNVNLPEKSGLNGEALFAAIRQERKIELAYEGHLYWDMRRWKLADKEYNKFRVHGIKITGAKGNYTYEYVDCDKQDRLFLAKWYTFPVPYSELANNSAIEQYDVWK